jgi:phage terminase large subunit
MVVAERADVVTYRPRGGHRRIFSCRDDVVVLEGPAGTGKTYAGLWYLHAMALKYSGMRALLARKQLSTLTGSAQVTFQEQVLGSGVYNVVPYGGSKFRPGAYIYPNGSQVVVGGMDKSSKVMSAEYDLIYVPEATELTETDGQALTTRLRHGVMPYQQLLMDCNPAGPQHWINQWCNTGRATRITTTHRDNPILWDRDAQDWTAFGREYMGKLWPLTGSMRKRLLDGIWAGAEGLVYPEYTYEDHVRPTIDHYRHIETDDPRAVDVTSWRTVLGADIGSRNPTVILTCHIAGDERVHVSRELYRAGMSSADIVAAIDAEASRVNPATIYIDPSAKMIIDDVRRLGWAVTPANNEVAEGIRRVHTAFQRGLTIDPTCGDTLDEFGMYAYPERARVETDTPAKEHDHAMDTIRYVIAGETSGDGELQVPSGALASYLHAQGYR